MPLAHLTLLPTHLTLLFVPLGAIDRKEWLWGYPAQVVICIDQVMTPLAATHKYLPYSLSNMARYGMLHHRPGDDPPCRYS